MVSDRASKFNRGCYRPLLLLAIVILMLFASGEAATIIVSKEDLRFHSIQVAINGAEDGDRIVVKSGVYRENLNVSKRLVLTGVDTGDGLPIVDSGSKKSAITLAADGIRIEGFVARNSGSSLKDAGIKVLSDENIIRGNTVTNNSYGIYMELSHRNVISENLANRNDVGIALSSSTGNLVEGNTARNNSFGGYFIGDSVNNTLIGNVARQNAWVGIFLSNSSKNILKGNLAVKNSDEGIWLVNSYSNDLDGNEVIDTFISGISLVNSHNNSIAFGSASGNLDGISLQNSRNNSIVKNNFSGNHFGIYVDRSSGNSIYLNDFVANVENVHSWSSANWWNSAKMPYLYNGLKIWGCLGNFWGDFGGRDAYGYGIGNESYRKGAVQDVAPLTEPFDRYILL